MEQFGKYTLVKKIGTGGMAEVFLARTTVAQGLNKTLVIKKIHTAYARSRQFVTMFVDEAKIALGLNHPNIIQVFDFGAVGDTYFLAMEHVEGMDLLRMLQEAAKARLRLPYGLSAYIVQQLAKGLDYAHRKADEFGQPLQIVHRDISPQNILLSWDGGVKIVDFGIARARDVHEEQGVIKGKFAYMSPEQARGEPVDCRSDVFAAGIVLFELVCARPLFHGKGKEALEMVKSGVIPRPKDFAPELPDSLERIILKALAFYRGDRYQTARDLQHELGKFQLEWGQRTGTLIESGALAQQLAQLVPPEHRVAAPRPAMEGTSARIVSSLAPSAVAAVVRGAAADEPVSDPIVLDPPSPAPVAVEASRGNVAREASQALRAQAQPPVPDAQQKGTTGTDRRERRYVYVLQGVLRGMAALEKRLGASGATRLVNEFYKVARDVAFKHDALLDVPRLPADGNHVPVEPMSPTSSPGTGIGGETTLRVCVGVPVSSEDDAGRAIKLALALVDALDGIGSDVEPELRLALAVQRGVALVRHTNGKGGDVSFEIEEATAAFAHKLARQARGAEILVGGRVFRAARGEWNFEALPAIDLPDDTLGGVTSASRPHVDEDTDPGVKRARVYRLRGPKERAQRMRERSNDVAGRLHGRELELKALRDAWRDVLVTKRKRQLLIVGDAGVGKRTLVRTFLEGIAPSEAVVIRTSGRVGTAMTPYGVIADLARDVLGLAEEAEPHEVERRLLRAMPLIFPGEEATSREARTALQIFGMLLGARGAAPAAPGEKIDAETRRQTLVQLLNRVEQKLESEKPIVLLGEDVHWTDQDSQELFAALLRVDTPRPIFGVMTSRPEPRIMKLAKELGTEIVLLDELSDGARRQMLAERFVPNADIDDLIEQVAARAGGNAFFIQELLDTLIERGILVADDDDGEHPGLLRWVKRDAPIHVPSTVEDLILARVDSLPPNEKDTLVHAAVLGRHVSAAALSQLLGRPVRLELDELVRRGLLSPTDGEYRFKNDMTMTVAYGLIPADTRAQMHRAVAARIAGAAGYRLGQDDALIARHLELAGDDVPAAERYLRAAGHAVELGGHADAFRQLTRALKLLPDTDHERRFSAHRLREEILRRLAKRPQQLRELHALRKEAELIGEPGKLAQAHCALAQFYIDVGKAPAALRAVAPALQYARDAHDLLLEAEALRLRAAIARLVGNAEESLRLAEQALELCDKAATAAGEQPGTNGGRPPTPVLMARATILNQRGTTLWNMGRLEASIESYAEALVIYRAIGMARHEARALNNMGIVFAALGEYEEALAHYKSALKIDQALGDRSGIALKLGNIGQCYSDLGDTVRAESYLGKALKVAEQTGDLSAAADAAVSWGQTKLQRGETRAALELFERGLALATENRERYQEVRALEYVALAHLAIGDPPEAALEMARSATEWARKVPMLVGIIYGLAFQALALSKLARHDEAVANIDEAVRLLDGARPEGAEHVHRWRAEVLSAAGRAADARAAQSRATAEVEAKAQKLRDPELRKHFLASRQRALGVVA
ncbi:MAG: tetratricopeptide repeat protein [Deltaproteobacteria bacterium]|nr:tetratricopeptide repeat protein [Deltaproteobacteria bacterium]MCW5804643.1 tetratricopeptide repeat protein [Deltaproteobacteria bacterium]